MSSLWALKGQGQVRLVHRPAPKAPHWAWLQDSAPRLSSGTPGTSPPPPRLGPWLVPGLGGAWHPGLPRPARATPFTHQEKGTQQAIPTRSPAAQYNNSWGKWEGPGIQRKEWSGQRKNRRDCEKELWMKCEKQRHQGEENSSKPKRGTSVFSPHTPGCWGKRRRGCTCGAARGHGPPALP